MITVLPANTMAPPEVATAEPDRDNHDRAVGAQTTEPVQDTGHADNLSPRPGPEDTLRSGHQRKRNIVRHGGQRDQRYRGVRRRRVLILGWR